MNMNPSKAFRDSAKKTVPLTKGVPKKVREAFQIAKVNESGIFQIEDIPGTRLYDRVYIFSDINYINKDNQEKQGVLRSLIAFLNFMQVDFKITIANEYRNMLQFISEIFTDIHREDYPEISKGMRQWITQKMEEGKLQDIEKVMYLTITCRTFEYEEAKSYFNGMDMQLEQLFSEMGSILLPLDGLQRLSLLHRFFYPKADDGQLELGENKDAMNDVLPYSMEAGFKNFLIMNEDQYVSVLFARRYGTSLNEGEVIRTLTDVSYPSFLTLDYAPVEKETLDAKLLNANLNNDRSISQEVETKQKNRQLATGISFQKGKKKDELEGYIRQVDTNSESCLLVGFLIVVTADTEELLAQRVEAMKQKGRKCRVFLETYNYVQLKAFNTALPVGCRQVDHMRAFLTSSLVALQPFYAQDLIEPGGEFLGRNKTTGHLVFGNRKKLPSPHGMIVGHTGSGKSYFMKETEVSQTLLETNDDITMIDPQNEMEAVCKEYGGQFIDFTPKSQVHLNPMEISEAVFADSSVHEKFIAEQSEWAGSFCEAIMSNMIFTQEHRSDIDKCIRQIYTKVFEQKKLKTQPTIVNLREELKKLMEEAAYPQDKERILKIWNSLELYTEGSYDMFAYPSNVNLDNRFTVYGLNNIKQSLWEPVMITIMHFLSVRMKYNQALQRATRFIVDETQVVSEHDTSAKILHEAVITYRKFGGICTFALQNLTRALENPELRDMFSNCGFKIFFDQGGVDAKQLAEVQKLSQMEFQSLSGKEEGHGVLVWRDKVILLDCKMSKDNVLFSGFSTDFHDKRRKKEENLEMPEEMELFVPTVGTREEDKNKIRKMAQMVALSSSEVATALSLTEKEARELLLEMCRDGILAVDTAGGNEFYRLVKGGSA